MTIKRYVRPYEQIAAGYGIAYRDPFTEQFICYPIPLNRVIAFADRLWAWLRSWTPNVLDTVYAQGVQKGREEKRHAAYDEGYQQGRKDEMEAIIKVIREVK